MTRHVLLALVAVGCAAAPTRPETRAVPSPIVQTGSSVLRTRAAEVPAESLGSQELASLLAQMTQAMRQAPGVGLAAPQIGVSLRAFVIEDNAQLMSRSTPLEIEERERVPVALRIFINPTVTPVGDERVTFFEGCLSVSGYAGLVTRYREVEVSAVDETGKPFTWRVRGWPARILQHEMDHLNGTLYVDRMHTRSFGTIAHVKERFGGKPISEILKAFELSP
jgi:peptide deformylase